MPKLSISKLLDYAAVITSPKLDRKNIAPCTNIILAEKIKVSRDARIKSFKRGIHLSYQKGLKEAGITSAGYEPEDDDFTLQGTVVKDLSYKYLAHREIGFEGKYERDGHYVDNTRYYMQIRDDSGDEIWAIISIPRTFGKASTFAAGNIIKITNPVIKWLDFPERNPNPTKRIILAQAVLSDHAKTQESYITLISNPQEEIERRIKFEKEENEDESTSFSRDKDIFILRAGRGVKAFMFRELSDLGELERVYNKPEHVAYNHWENWKKFKPIRGYIHFNIIKPLEEFMNEQIKDAQEMKTERPFYMRDGIKIYGTSPMYKDGAKELAKELAKAREWPSKQCENFLKMSRELGTNVIIIQPNTKIWDKEGQEYDKKMHSTFVFVGKTISNLKQEEVNFGEFTNTKFDKKEGAHSNFVELEGHIIKKTKLCRKQTYQSLLGKYPEDDSWFVCYRYDKAEINDENWNELDELYIQ